MSTPWTTVEKKGKKRAENASIDPVSSPPISRTDSVATNRSRTASSAQTTLSSRSVKQCLRGPPPLPTFHSSTDTSSVGVRAQPSVAYDPDMWTHIGKSGKKTAVKETDNKSQSSAVEKTTKLATAQASAPSQRPQRVSPKPEKSSPVPLTAEQIHRSVEILCDQYPGLYSEYVVEVFRKTGFDIEVTQRELYRLHGSPAAPQSENAHYSGSQTNSSSSFENRALLLKRLPTFVANGQMEDLGKMAARGGLDESYNKVREDFLKLHDDVREKQKKLDEAIAHKRRSKDPRTIHHHNTTCAEAKRARIRVEEQIDRKGRWWNTYLNPEVIDLHWMIVRHAMKLLKERIREMTDRIKDGSTSRTLYIVTGRGKHSASFDENSADGTPKIKKEVAKMLKDNEYRYASINIGCFKLDL